MASDAFIDTSGFYAILVSTDDRHAEAAEHLKRAAAARRRFVTTDYILDETATLLQARRLEALVPPFFESVFASRACRIVWMDAARFGRARAAFLRSLGRGWSFTDCASFVVMRELRLTEALTKDANFEEAGFRALLSD